MTYSIVATNTHVEVYLTTVINLVGVNNFGAVVNFGEGYRVREAVDVDDIEMGDIEEGVEMGEVAKDIEMADTDEDIEMGEVAKDVEMGAKESRL